MEISEYDVNRITENTLKYIKIHQNTWEYTIIHYRDRWNVQWLPYNMTSSISWYDTSHIRENTSKYIGIHKNRQEYRVLVSEATKKNNIRILCSLYYSYQKKQHENRLESKKLTLFYRNLYHGTCHSLYLNYSRIASLLEVYPFPLLTLIHKPSNWFVFNRFSKVLLNNWTHGQDYYNSRKLPEKI